MYAAAWIDGRNVYMHRLILGLRERYEFADHIDFNGLNNTRENLRRTTPRGNSTRRRARKSDSRAVQIWRRSGRWMARHGTTYIGSFRERASAELACIIAQDKIMRDEA